LESSSTPLTPPVSKREPHEVFWGGENSDGEIVVTSWIDANDGAGRFRIWRPKTNHGGLKAQWEVGNIRVGTEVRLILLRQRGNVPLDTDVNRTVARWLVLC
jgi:hypothetical protein